MSAKATALLSSYSALSHLVTCYGLLLLLHQSFISCSLKSNKIMPVPRAFLLLWHNTHIHTRTHTHPHSSCAMTQGWRRTHHKRREYPRGRLSGWLVYFMPTTSSVSGPADAECCANPRVNSLSFARNRTNVRLRSATEHKREKACLLSLLSISASIDDWCVVLCVLCYFPVQHSYHHRLAVAAAAADLLTCCYWDTDAVVPAALLARYFAMFCGSYSFFLSALASSSSHNTNCGDGGGSLPLSRINQ